MKKGQITRFLAIDCETSGLFFNGSNPAVNATGQYYQAVSWGMVVVDAITLNPIKELYIELKWDGVSLWADQAEKIHGLSKSYLETNGMSRAEAIEEIGNLIIDHWGPDAPVCIAGHNPQFDLAFLRNDLQLEGLNIKFGARMIDTNSIGFAVFNTHSSDELFELLNFKRNSTHNALTDAKGAVHVIKTVRTIADSCF